MAACLTFSATAAHLTPARPPAAAAALWRDCLPDAPQPHLPVSTALAVVEELHRRGGRRAQWAQQDAAEERLSRLMPQQMQQQGQAGRRARPPVAFIIAKRLLGPHLVLAGERCAAVLLRRPRPEAGRARALLGQQATGVLAGVLVWGTFKWLARWWRQRCRGGRAGGRERPRQAPQARPAGAGAPTQGLPLVRELAVLSCETLATNTVAYAIALAIPGAAFSRTFLVRSSL